MRLRSGGEDDAAPKGEGDSDEEGADDLHEEAMRNTASKFQRPPPLPKDAQRQFMSASCV